MYSALRHCFLFIFKEKLRLARGPKAMPPCLQIGDLVEPARARPVPFCFHGFLPPPRTSPRVLVFATGLLALFICTLTACCTNSGTSLTSKILGFKSISLVASKFLL